MVKYATLIFILIFVFLLSCERQTKLFKNIEVQGRLVNFYTKQPIPNMIVRLKSDNVHSASSYSQASILLDTYTTKIDGSFILKSKASREGDYYIQLDTDEHIHSYTSTDTSFSSSPNTIVQLGDLHSGDYTYWCKVRFIPGTGNCAWVTTNGDLVKIQSGTDTTVICLASISYLALRKNKNTGFFNYRTGTCLNPNSATYLIKQFQFNGADTVRLQVNY